MREHQRVTRRSFLRWASAAGAAAAGSILVACGGSKSAPNPGTSAPTAAGITTGGTTTGGTTTTSGTAGTTAASGTTTSGETAAASIAGLPTPITARIPAPAGKRDLILAQGADITTLDPQLSTTGNDDNATFNLYDNLTFRDLDYSLKPMLATEWKATGDKQWTFKLRQGVKFHSGDPFTAADVKFTIERTYDPNAKTLVSTIFTTIETIETPDDATVIFNTKAPDPLLPARLANYGGQMMPAKYFQQVGAAGFGSKPVGTGPIKFVEQVKDDHATFAANTEYWGGAPGYDHVIFRPRPETAARVASLLSGESDIIANVPPDQTDQINKAGKTRTEGALFDGLYVLAVNSKVPPLTNKFVKQALSYAMDRASILKEIWRNQGAIPNGAISRGDFAYDPSVPPLPYDPNKAKDLLKQANYNNEEIIIETTQGYLPNDRQMAEAIAQMWKAAGINAKVELIEISVRAQKNTAKSFKGLWWSDPGSTTQDPDGMLWRLLGPGGPQDYWRDPEFDKLGAEARVSLDANLRQKDYRRMDEIFRENFPWLPIIQPYTSWGVANYVNFKLYGTLNLNLRKEITSFVTG